MSIESIQEKIGPKDINGRSNNTASSSFSSMAKLLAFKLKENETLKKKENELPETPSSSFSSLERYNFLHFKEEFGQFLFEKFGGNLENVEENRSIEEINTLDNKLIQDSFNFISSKLIPQQQPSNFNSTRQQQTTQTEILTIFIPFQHELSSSDSSSLVANSSCFELEDCMLLLLFRWICDISQLFQLSNSNEEDYDCKSNENERNCDDLIIPCVKIKKSFSNNSWLGDDKIVTLFISTLLTSFSSSILYLQSSIERNEVTRSESVFGHLFHQISCDIEAYLHLVDFVSKLPSSDSNSNQQKTTTTKKKSKKRKREEESLNLQDINYVKSHRLSSLICHESNFFIDETSGEKVKMDDEDELKKNKRQKKEFSILTWVL